MKRVFAAIAICLCSSTSAWAQVQGEYRVPRAAEAPKIDGVLDDRSRSFGVGGTLQPNQHLSQSLEFDRVRFWRPDTGVDVYDVNIVNSRTTYQFDKHFLLRFLAQHDSSSTRVLTDFLASYEFVPGTVFHVGYGSLFEKGFAEDTRYLPVNRGLFLKASDLRRF